ncbi:MAG: ATP-dependent DNA helicase RecG [Pirellulales bacterium]|nr:ATP-dependent DNA helicase RecG [Pirellulales bacterium]
MNVPEKSAADVLAAPVQFLPGVGPRRAETLARLGLHTAADVLFLFPRSYQDFSRLRSVSQLVEGDLQTVTGTVEEFEARGTDSGKCILGVLVRDDEGGFLRAIWFNQPTMQERFARGQRVSMSGKPKLNGLFWEMAHPVVTPLADDERNPEGQLLPVYPLTEGIKQWQLRRIVRGALDQCAGALEEVFPEAYLKEHDLWPIRQALPEVHFPSDADNLARARRRFVYQELFILQLGLALRRAQQRASRRAPALETTAKIDARIRRLFPFELTAGQKAAIAEIAADLAQPVAMNRLLQGDVGSGKTVVAAYAMLVAVAHGHQAVLMAPTEVLAQQHSLTLERLLAGSQVRIASLVGGLSAGARQETLARIAAGEADLIVGTQAVIQEDVAFAKLALVVIDEQHKFGVRQRATLRRAGDDPHYLVMTATPIPRTVTMTLFGDLDVSTLRDAPPGRQPVKTYLADETKRAKWWDFFSRKLREGRQGYVVTPLVDESDQTPAVSVEETYEALVNGPLEAFRVGLIHGRMTSAEKDAVMEDFRAGRLQALVCTSVVEVGVDVPNATLMTIEDGQRFGLAQLHQLRGRISRGSHPGFCTVFANPTSDESRKRLDAFVSTTDGFQLAQVDFELRGPGELFGTKQHGLPPMRIADLTRDGEVLDESRRDALALVASDPGLARDEHALLRRMVVARYGKVLELGDVG